MTRQRQFKRLAYSLYECKYSNSNFGLKQIFELGPNFAHSHLATELASL